jgi:hypothetical protein
MMTEEQMYDMYNNIRLIIPVGEPFEIRLLNTKTGTISGYFDDAELAVKAVARYDGKVAGMYMTMNRLDPELMGRAYNKLVEWAQFATSDAEVIGQRWLLLDADPARPAHLSSTDVQHEAALAKIQTIAKDLVARGWPKPIIADSGNGGHALFPCQGLRDGELTTRRLQKLLKALAKQYDDPPGTKPRITLDTSVYNPSRITKLYGSLTGKGDGETPNRPHRRSCILEVPVALRQPKAKPEAKVVNQ